MAQRWESHDMVKKKTTVKTQEDALEGAVEDTTESTPEDTVELIGTDSIAQDSEGSEDDGISTASQDENGAGLREFLSTVTRPAHKSVSRFARRNSMVLSVMASVFIILEGVIIWYYPSEWWKPLAIVATATILVLIWMNARTVVRAALSIAGLMALASLSMITGTSYAGSAITGTIMSMTIVFVWVLTLTISYYTPSSRSRWSASILAALAAFISEYAFLATNSITLIITTGVIIGIIAGMIVLKTDLIGIRRSRHAIRFPASHEDTAITSRHPGDVDMDVVWERMNRAMSSLWPGMENGEVELFRSSGDVGIVSRMRERRDANTDTGKSKKRSSRYSRRDGPSAMWVWYGEGKPTIIVIPIVLKEPLESAKRVGLLHDGKPVQKTMQWLQSKIELSVPGPYPVPILLDVLTVNDDTATKPGIIAYKPVYGTGQAFMAITSYKDRSDKNLKLQVADCVARFKGGSPSSDRDEQRIARRLNKISIGGRVASIFSAITHRIKNEPSEEDAGSIIASEEDDFNNTKEKDD